MRLPDDYVPRAHMRIDPADLIPFTARDHLELVLVPKGWDLKRPTPIMTEDADWIREHLQLMGLAAYHHPHANLIGFAEPELQHPHDRWVYRVMSGYWYRISSEARPGSGGYGVGSLKDSLLNLMDLLHDVAQPAMFPEILRRMHLLGLEEGNGYREASRRAACKPGPNPHEAHEFLYHRQAWLRANPEAAGMPVKLVLRMHGLSHLVDLVDQDWRFLREDRALPDLTTWGLEED